ncbi:hypothetical protein GGS23DRAFT_591072 [Durotheca rogersii]|uniref:uncharacterized protein n=1 Tax=Durotheca rogersii TaxID=419775 RepID=UPI00221E82E8|nr:uncharacterized protein GGS23DRAFT_591072 [Durotheca rogersii]KAI5853661.1 hypothetical protein GGS23DRAFT_591072 [Durotheca rogersii]
MNSELLSRTNCNCENQDNTTHSSTRAQGKTPGFSASDADSSKTIAVTNWDELLVPPIDRKWSIVCTSENWTSRLAAVGIAIRLSRPTVILPKLPHEICWACVEKHVADLKLERPGTADEDIVLVL